MKSYLIQYYENGREQWDIISDASDEKEAVEMLHEAAPAVPMGTLDIISIEEWAPKKADQEPEKTAEEWAAESDAVQAATLAALGPVIATEPEEQPEPEETAQEKTDRENREYCQRIAEELELYATGDAHKCPHCGAVHDFSDWEETEHDSDTCPIYTLYTCPHCGQEVDADDLEQLSIYDYFSDCLDIEYRCNSNREYKSVSVMVTCGGPNVYIDTAERAVLLYWWTDRARYYLSSAAVDAVDAWAEEYWNL